MVHRLLSLASLEDGRGGLAQIDHKINIDPGRPSVLFRRQLCHIL